MEHVLCLNINYARYLMFSGAEHINICCLWSDLALKINTLAMLWNQWLQWSKGWGWVRHWVPTEENRSAFKSGGHAMLMVWSTTSIPLESLDRSEPQAFLMLSGAGWIFLFGMTWEYSAKLTTEYSYSEVASFFVKWGSWQCYTSFSSPT